MNKIEQLTNAMRSHGRLAVMFSGGIDSALLARLAHDALGDHCAALTIDSAVVPRSEMTMARELAGEIGIRHYILRLNELEQEHFKLNPPNRCYSCRKVRDAAAWRWAEGHECPAFHGPSYLGRALKHQYYFPIFSLMGVQCLVQSGNACLHACTCRTWTQPINDDRRARRAKPAGGPGASATCHSR